MPEKSYMIFRTKSTYVFKSLLISSNLLKIIMASAVSRVLQNQQVDYRKKHMLYFQSKQGKKVIKTEEITSVSM